ncbi:MAG: bifunctional diguanylate cyclase/phosphodiesterase [Kineosporiaceae bacterium]
MRKPSDDAPAGIGSGRSANADTDPVAVDRLIRRVRWLCAVLSVVQFTLYAPPPGRELPFSRWWGAVPFVMLVGANLLGTLRARRGRSATAPGWALSQLIWDSLVGAIVIGMFTFDDSSALWALLIIPVLEASTRGWRGRALVTFAVLCAGYVVRAIASSVFYPYNNVTVDSVTYRLGVLSIVAISTAGLAGRLTRQIVATAAAQAEADQLRAVSVATRRMSSLDVPTVVRELTGAAEAFGFSRVQLRSAAGVIGADHDDRPGDGSLSRWFEAAAAAMGTDGYAVLDRDDELWDGADGGRRPDADEVTVVAEVLAGEAVEVMLVGRHPLPLQNSQVEALVLLAVQAGGALANARRFTEGRAFEERLAHQATHDSLTGLPNRALLRDRAATTLARSLRSDTMVAFMFIDLDRFKEINDVLGHAIGDALLVQVANRLNEHLRAEDTCSRIGGDEFVVLAGDQPDAAAILELAHRLGDALHQPFQFDDVCLDIEASLGVAWAPAHGHEVDALLHHADTAMYAAKTRRQGVVAYHASEDPHTPTHLATLGDLRRALDATDQLTAHYQPIVALADGALVGVEALIRWNHPTRGDVRPEQFIAVAEGTALIHRITDHVMENALATLAGWQAHGLVPDLSVNLSTRTLLDSSLPQRIRGLLEAYGIPPNRVRLEITESALLADPTRAIATMHQLTETGLRFSIDDFGTGYSSMSYLKNLPVDEIKIDRSFVTQMLTNPHDHAMVRSLVDLAHSLDLHVVAEGVEDQDTLEALARIGCELAQGYHVAHPMPGSALSTWSSPVRPAAALDQPEARAFAP